MTAHERLLGEDAAWLHMEDPTNPMIVTGVVELEGRVSEDELEALLERMCEPPRFRSRVVEPLLHIGAPHWEPDPAFVIARHVEHVDLERGDAALRTFVGRIVGTLLPRDRPLWRTYVIHRPDAGTALVFRVHHAIADGFGLLGVLLSLSERPDAMRSGMILPAAATEAPRAGELACALEHLLRLPPDPATPLRGPLGVDKRVAWSEPIPLAQVKAIAARAHATVNDVLVAAVAGALRRTLVRGGATVPTAIRALVPVNLRHPMEATALGNRFGLVFLELPLDVRDPLARVSAVNRRMRDKKQSAEPIVAHALLRAMGVLPVTVEEIGVKVFAKKATLVLTNVPGPRARVELAGSPVKRILFWVPQSGRVGLGISIFSYAGEVTIGVLSDATILQCPELLVDDLRDELITLRSATEIEGGTPWHL